MGNVGFEKLGPFFCQCGSFTLVCCNSKFFLVARRGTLLMELGLLHQYCGFFPREVKNIIFALRGAHKVRRMFMQSAKAPCEVQMAIQGENAPHKVEMAIQGENAPHKVEMAMQGENAPHKVEMAMQGENAPHKVEMSHARWKWPEKVKMLHVR